MNQWARTEHRQALRAMRHGPRGSIFNGIILSAHRHLTYEEMAHELGVSSSMVGYHLRKARDAQAANDAHAEPAAVAAALSPSKEASVDEKVSELSLLQILLATGKVSQEDIDALATPAPVAEPVEVEAAPACSHVDPTTAAIEIHRLVHASGGHLSQANIGRIWGYSPAWLGNILARR